MRITTQQIKILLPMMVLALAYQNCAPQKLSINEQLKNKTLSEKTLFLEDANSEDTASKIASFTFVCPLEIESARQIDLLSSEKLKVIVEEYNYITADTKVVCEVHDVKKQILDTRSVNLASCDQIPNEQNTNLNLYVVPEYISSRFERHRLNADTTPLALGGYSLNYFHLKTTDSKTLCDDAGDPLLVKLAGPDNSKLELSAPSEGLSFDLLGERSAQHPHNKVRTSWFKSVPTDTYFLVKPNSDKLVLGIDEFFADNSRGPDTKFTKQGFAALAKFDDNKDQLIDEDDVIFSELRLWQDLNADAIVQDSELATLSEKNVKALDLRYETRFREMDKYGNQSRYKSVIVMKDDSYGIMYDLYLRYIHHIEKPTPAVAPVEEPESESPLENQPHDGDSPEVVDGENSDS